MYSTTVHIERPEGTVIASGIAAHYELAAPLPAHDEDEHRDTLRVDLYLLSVPAVGLQRRDVVQDERNIDPLTGQPVRLRVISAEVFERDHIEALAEQLIGT
jgi:hypothetical protein